MQGTPDRRDVQRLRAGLVRMRDRLGNTVEVQALTDGHGTVRAVLIPRGPGGLVLGRARGDGLPDLTDPAGLAPLGIDVASLVPVTS